MSSHPGLPPTRRPRNGHYHLTATATLALLHIILGIIYAIPDIARGYPPPVGIRRINIVTYIESLGPVWQVLFGLTALLLIVGMARPRLLAAAHTLAGAGMAVFASALWMGWALSDPRPTILGALGYSACVVWHLTAGVAFARLNARPETLFEELAKPHDSEDREGGS